MLGAPIIETQGKSLIIVGHNMQSNERQPHTPTQTIFGNPVKGVNGPAYNEKNVQDRDSSVFAVVLLSS
jgi:hypothetical protein